MHTPCRIVTYNWLLTAIPPAQTVCPVYSVHIIKLQLTIDRHPTSPDSLPSVLSTYYQITIDYWPPFHQPRQSVQCTQYILSNSAVAIPWSQTVVAPLRQFLISSQSPNQHLLQSKVSCIRVRAMKAYRGRRGAHEIGGWVILRAGVDVFWRRENLLPLPRFEPPTA